MRYYITMSSNDVVHYGVLGMKWGIRRAQKKVRKLERRSKKLIRRYEKGKIEKEELEKLSAQVRKQNNKISKGLRKARKFLDKVKESRAKDLINRYTRNPEKIKAMKEYLKEMKIEQLKISEVRTQLMDARI